MGCFGAAMQRMHSSLQGCAPTFGSFVPVHLHNACLVAFVKCRRLHSKSCSVVRMPYVCCVSAHQRQPGRRDSRLLELVSSGDIRTVVMMCVHVLTNTCMPRCGYPHCCGCRYAGFHLVANVLKCNAFSPLCAGVSKEGQKLWPNLSG